MWPGSPQTALIFVGLPLLTALVLLATPLHDPGPPAPREGLAAPLRGDVPTPDPRLVEGDSGGAAMPRAVARRRPTIADRVPPVIYETRRTIHRSRGARVSGGGAEPITLAATTARAGFGPTAASLGTQSP